MHKYYNLRISRITKYSNMVVSAVRLGVELDDIMMETSKFHGKKFASLVLNQVNDLLQ